MSPPVVSSERALSGGSLLATLAEVFERALTLLSRAVQGGGALGGAWWMMMSVENQQRGTVAAPGRAVRVGLGLRAEELAAGCDGHAAFDPPGALPRPRAEERREDQSAGNLKSPLQADTSCARHVCSRDSRDTLASSPDRTPTGAPRRARRIRSTHVTRAAAPCHAPQSTVRTYEPGLTARAPSAAAAQPPRTRGSHASFNARIPTCGSRRWPREHV